MTQNGEKMLHFLFEVLLILSKLTRQFTDEKFSFMASNLLLLETVKLTPNKSPVYCIKPALT
jgi:hypothetical protein